MLGILYWEGNKKGQNVAAGIFCLHFCIQSWELVKMTIKLITKFQNEKGKSLTYSFKRGPTRIHYWDKNFLLDKLLFIRYTSQLNIKTELYQRPTYSKPRLTVDSKIYETIDEYTNFTNWAVTSSNHSNCQYLHGKLWTATTKLYGLMVHSCLIL